MSRSQLKLSSGSERVTIGRDELRVEVSLRPFSMTLTRAFRVLLPDATVWVADGVVHDRFIPLTEGVVAHEELAPAEWAEAAYVVGEREHGAELQLVLRGGRGARLQLELGDERTLIVELIADDEPQRLALEWDRRPDERLVGLGARHGNSLDQAGRTLQLGADRRYTGPDCPPDLLAEGGIPQGDCAPVPWLLSSQGYAAWVRTDANGTSFDLRERVSVSTRGSAGPLAVAILCDPSPAARLRHLCRLTGFPALLPEWGYGFWKSRDVYEHQDDVFDDARGFWKHEIPLDAIVLDSPWETQYNTWKFNPHQFPDAPGMLAALRARGVRIVVWVTPWVNLDSRDGQIPPQPGSERLHREPAPNYAAGAAAGHFVLGSEDEEPFVARWRMGTGSPVDLTSAPAEAWWRAQAKHVLELGVRGIKADDGEGYYIPANVRLADGRTGAEAAWALGGLHRECLQRALDEAIPAKGCCSPAAGGQASTRSVIPGVATRRPTSGRSVRSSRPP
jgi:alpha-glucosidase (family GH31 glycosyl hydrolase)